MELLCRAEKKIVLRFGGDGWVTYDAAGKYQKVEAEGNLATMLWLRRKVGECQACDGSRCNIGEILQGQVKLDTEGLE